MILNPLGLQSLKRPTQILETQNLNNKNEPYYIEAKKLKEKVQKEILPKVLQKLFQKRKITNYKILLDGLNTLQQDKNIYKQ